MFYFHSKTVQVFGLVYGCVLLGVENQDCSVKQAFYFRAVHSDPSWGLVLCLVLFALISIIVAGCTYTCVRPSTVWRSEDTLHWFFLPLGVPGSNLGHQASMAGTFTCWTLLLTWIFFFISLVDLVWGHFCFVFEIVPQNGLELKMPPRLACGWTLASVSWV